jgi:hypothetical protein
VFQKTVTYCYKRKHTTGTMTLIKATLRIGTLSNTLCGILTGAITVYQQDLILQIRSIKCFIMQAQVA